MPAWGAYHTPRHARYPHNGGIDTSASKGYALCGYPQGYRSSHTPARNFPLKARAKLWPMDRNGFDYVRNIKGSAMRLGTSGCRAANFFAHKIAVKAAQSVTQL